MCVDGDSDELPRSLAAGLSDAAPVGRRDALLSRSSFSVPVFQGAVRVTDMVLLLLAAVCGVMVHALLAPHGAFTPAMRNASLLTTLIGVVTCGYCLARARSYEIATLRSGRVQAQIIGASLAFGIAASWLASRLIPPIDVVVDRSWSPAWPVVAGLMLALSRVTIGFVLRAWTRAGRLARKVAVVGSAELASPFLSRLAATADLRVVGVYDIGDVPPAERSAVQDLLARCRAEPVDAIVIALPLEESGRITRLQHALRPAIADVYLATDLVGYSNGAAQVAAVAGGPAILMQARPLKDWDALQKRVFDVVLAALLLVLLAPVLACIAVAIRLDSSGPILFRQPRVGFNNNLFDIYKFRSMYHHMSDLLTDRQTTQGDERITRTGKWLRKFSLDELPQLVNVLRGEMSLVGPRPHAPNTKAAGQHFAEIIATYAERHRVKPGITGWAQVNGWRGETRTYEQIENRVAHDLQYIESWSLAFDVKILMLTVLREIASRNAF